MKLVHWLSPIPALVLAIGYVNGNLGVDPGKAFILETGIWTVNFLLLTLLATPLLRWGKIRWFTMNKRALGLWTFFYSLLHLSGYVLFLLPSWDTLLQEIVKKPYIAVGAIAILIFTMMSVTSNKFSQKLLKKWWKRLHMLVYPVVGLVLVHWFLLIRSDYSWLLAYAVSFAMVLGYRFYLSRR